MALKIQYNKTFLQQIRKQLAIRVKVLPTLKSKETALRIEVKRVQEAIKAMEIDFEQFKVKNERSDPFWVRFPDILKVKEARILRKNTAGTKIPVYDGVEFSLATGTYFDQPVWLDQAVDQLKKEIEYEVQLRIMRRQFEILHRERRKTTQKVNLYEKVQIPEFEAGISKIKRFLEDKDNISKSAQKIVKTRTQEMERAA